MTSAASEYIMVRYEKIRYVSIGVHRLHLGMLHEHGVLELGLVLDGQVRVSCRDSETVVEPGGLLLFNAYEPHRLVSVSPSPARVLSIWISTHFGKEYSVRISNLTFDRQALASLPSQETAALKELLLQAAQSYFSEPAGYQLECVGYVNMLLTTLLRHLPYRTVTDTESTIKKKNLSRTRRIASYIEQHYKERLTLSQLAAEEGLTTAYMSRIFRELFGMSFQEYLNLLRLERAIPLIRDPSVYLVDVCMECGFSDTRYLNAVCQKTFGCTASQFRKQQTSISAAPLVEKLQSGATEPKYDNRESLSLLQQYQKWANT